MIRRIEKFVTDDGIEFDTEKDAINHAFSIAEKSQYKLAVAITEIRSLNESLRFLEDNK